MRAAIVSLLAILLAQPARAEDWPQWGSPTRDGVWREDGILEKFPSDRLNITWRATAGGGWPSPVAAKGCVSLFDSELATPKAKERLRRFDAERGRLLWTYSYDVNYPEWAFGQDQNGGPTSTPVVFSERKIVCASLAADGR